MQNVHSAQQINQKFIGLFESGLPEATQIAATLRSIPLRHWSVNVAQKFDEAILTVCALVHTDSVLSEVILRQTARPTQSDRGCEDNFFGAVRYTAQPEESPCEVVLQRPELIRGLITYLLPLLGDKSEFEAKFDRVKRQAQAYSIDRQWAVDTIESIRTGQISATNLGADAAKKLVEAECARRTFVDDEDEPTRLESVKAAASITFGDVTAKLVVAAVRFTDHNDNIYRFDMAVADLSDASGRSFRLTADSDFGGHFKAIAEVLKRVKAPR